MLLLHDENLPDQYIEKLKQQSNNIYNNRFRESTQRSYVSDLKIFIDFCDKYGFKYSPALPETIVLFITEQLNKGRETSTLLRRISSISSYYTCKEIENTTKDKKVIEYIRSIKKSYGMNKESSLPITLDKIKKLIEECDLTTNAGIRDRAILGLGFSGALRRSELVGLIRKDIEFYEYGIVLTVRNGKTDKYRKGRKVPIPHGKNIKPIEYLKDLLQILPQNSENIFTRILKGDRITSECLTDQAINLIVKKYCKLVGIDSSLFSAHGMRSGYLTTAGQRGDTLFKMKAVSGHVSTSSLEVYVKQQELFDTIFEDSFL